jgi:hypothetical protein
MTRYYCVLDITTGRILYAGTSEAATAAALDPGTVYGFGRTRRAAWWMAVRQRSDVLSAEGKRVDVPEYVEPQEAEQ